jgi:hypothetical protein
MPERNRRTPKMKWPLALLGVLGLVSWAAIARLRQSAAPGVEAVRTPMSEPVTDPAPAPRRPRSTRRLALVAAYTTLFFAGAAFTAVAGDQSVGLPEEDAAWTQVTTTTTAAAEPAPEPAPEPAAPVAPEDSAPAQADPYVETDVAPPARPAPVADTATTGETAPAVGSWTAPPRARTAAAAPKPARASTKTAAAPPATRAPAAKPVVEPVAVSPARVPEIEHDGGSTVWLSRALPDPTPASRRLTRPFARQLFSASRRHGADWAVVLGVLRAQGDRGSTPATRAELERLAQRLTGRAAWRGALAISGNTGFADRAEALADLYRSVGIEALATGFEAAKTRLVERLLDDEHVWVYGGGREDLEEGRIDVRVVVLIGYLTERHGAITVSSLFSGHRLFARPGVVSAHIHGHAVDIAAIEGTPIAGHQEPGGVTEQAVRSILLLPAELQPQQVISLLGLGGPSFPLSDHGDHIHVGY